MSGTTVGEKRPSTRILELDSLRALAALNLLLFHFTYLYQNKYGYLSPLGINYPYGKYGVQLFFMLSGLVNAMTLLSKRRSDDFLAARLIRICPPFWAVMLVNMALFSIYPLAANPPSTAQWLANLTLVPGLLGHECVEPVTWTLQVELLFYLLLVSWFSIGALQRPILLTSVVLSVVLGVGLPLQHGWIDPESAGFRVLDALDSVLILKTLPLLLIGILLNERRCGRGAWLTHGAAIAACIIVFHGVDERDFNPLATLLFTAMLGFSAWGRLPVLRLKPFAFVGGISYSLYLLHNNLGSTIIYHLNPITGSWPALLLSTGLVFALATASSFWFERPVGNWLRGMWIAHRSRQSAAGSPSPSAAYSNQRGA